MSPQAREPKEQKDRFDLWMGRIERYGIALAFLVALLGWLRPKLDRAFDKHMQFMDATEQVQSQNAETLRTQAVTQEKQVEISAGTREMVSRINGRLDETHGMVKQIRDRLNGPAVGHAEPQPPPDESQ
ncbi:MAG: hypothetical protein E6Q40_08860 [Cupriavidus sp.]|nr:MAG: hypothetical protein E6Q40_08860 [Cupriavidus sp.]